MKLISTVSYCGLFNLLDFPAGTVKVTEVSEIDELCLKDYPENDLWEKLVKKATKVCFFIYDILNPLHLSLISYISSE